MARQTRSGVWASRGLLHGSLAEAGSDSLQVLANRAWLDKQSNWHGPFAGARATRTQN